MIFQGGGGGPGPPVLPLDPGMEAHERIGPFHLDLCRFIRQQKIAEFKLKLTLTHVSVNKIC